MGMVVLLWSDLLLLGMVKLTKVLNLAIRATQSSLLLIKEFVLLVRPMAEFRVGKVTLQHSHSTHGGLMSRIHSGAVFPVCVFPLKTAVVGMGYMPGKMSPNNFFQRLEITFFTGVGQECSKRIPGQKAVL